MRFAKMKLILTCLIGLFLAGCASNATYNPSPQIGSVAADGGPSKTIPLNNDSYQYENISQRTLRKIVEVENTEISRRACYQAIVDIETAKMESLKPLYEFIAAPNRSEMAQIVGLQMLQNQTLVSGLLGQRQAPLECKQMGVYEYKVAQTGQWLDFGGDVLSTGLKVVLGKEFIDLGKHAIDKWSEPRIQSGGNSTNVLGDGSSVDNRTFTNPCAGTIDEATGQCVTPVEEMPEEEAAESCPEGQVGVPPDQCFTLLPENEIPPSDPMGDELTRLLSQ